MSSSRKKLLISLKLLPLILLGSFFISLLFALIHTILTINLTSAIFGLTLLVSSLITYLYNQNVAKNKYRLGHVKQVEVITNNQRIVEETTEKTVSTNDSLSISTGGGNYNDKIGGNYIQGNSAGRDLVTKNITIEGKRVKISSNYSQTLCDLKDILNEMIVQSSNVVEAISRFAEQLTEELRKQPDVKLFLNEIENSSEQELVNKIIIDLLNKTYDQISKINQITRISQSNPIQTINISNASEFIENVEYCGNNEYDISYKEYTIHLFQEKSRQWLYRIRRSDSLILEPRKRERSCNIYFAIGRAIDQIDKEIDLRWKNKHKQF